MTPDVGPESHLPPLLPVKLNRGTTGPGAQRRPTIKSPRTTRKPGFRQADPLYPERLQGKQKRGVCGSVRGGIGEVASLGGKF